MRFVFGRPPDDPSFAPEQGGWQRIREFGPGTLMLLGSLIGVPLCALVVYGWSLLPLDDVSVQFVVPDLGSWGVVLMPLLVLVSIAGFLGVLIFVHELIHVFACPGFGLTRATVLGVWPSRLMAYGSHEGAVRCRRFLVVGLAPLVILSLGPLVIAAATGLSSTFFVLVSVVNSMLCGGDILICLMLLGQVPLSANVRNHGWDTWWQPVQP